MFHKYFTLAFLFSKIFEKPINIGNAKIKYLGNPVSVPDNKGNRIIAKANNRYESLTFLMNAKTNPITAKINDENSNSATQNSYCLNETVKNIFRYL